MVQLVPTRVLHILFEEFAGVARQVELLMRNAPPDRYDWRSLVIARRPYVSTRISFPHYRVRRSSLFGALEIWSQIRHYDPHVVHLWVPWLDRTTGMLASASKGRPLVVSVQHGVANYKSLIYMNI